MATPGNPNKKILTEDLLPSTSRLTQFGIFATGKDTLTVVQTFRASTRVETNEPPPTDEELPTP